MLPNSWLATRQLAATSTWPSPDTERAEAQTRLREQYLFISCGDDIRDRNLGLGWESDNTCDSQTHLAGS